MTSALWWTLGVLAMLRAAYPRYLERRSAARFAMRRDGVIEGAEPIDLPRQGAPAVLVLHGGGDTPQSVRLLAEFIHARGYAVRAPLLTRHGRRLADLRALNAEEWRKQARTELDELAKHDVPVAIVGQSVGGALALDLAASGSRVFAIALLSPWVAMPAPLRLIAALSPIWGPLLPYLPSMGSGSIHDPVALAEARTHGLVTPAGLRAIAAVADFAAAALPRVMVPTLIVQSREDQRIAPAAAQAAFDQLGVGDKRLEWVTGAGHVISMDYGRERIFAMVADWLDAHRA